MTRVERAEAWARDVGHELPADVREETLRVVFGVEPTAEPPVKVDAVEARGLSADVRVRRDLNRSYLNVWDVPPDIFAALPGERDGRYLYIVAGRLDVTFYEARP